MTMTRAEVEKKVGGTTIGCREFEITGKGMKGRFLVSFDVPETMVEQDVEMEQPTVGGGSSKSSIKSEIVAFVKKYPPPTPV